MGPEIKKPLCTPWINHYDHDSAVTLARDGKIVIAIAEERPSRRSKDTLFLEPFPIVK